MNRLSPAALARAENLITEARGLLALDTLVGIVDPCSRMGRWQLAGRLATLLQRFEATSWVRIRRGGREPRGPAELAMACIMAAGLPLSQRRIIDLIG